MAHTIEEMQEAKRKLCYEIGNKLAAFENEYNVEICEIEYQPGVEYIGNWETKLFKYQVTLKWR